MNFIIGTISTGTLHPFKNQAIKTKFFVFLFPIFPIYTFYQIADNNGIKLPLSKESIWVGYSRTTLLMIAAILLISADGNKFIIGLGSLLCINGLIFWAIGWDLSSDDEIKRKFIGKAIGYNMLPELLPKDIRENIYNELLTKYTKEYVENRWKERILENKMNEHSIFILYALAYYTSIIEPSLEHSELFNLTHEFAKKTDYHI